MRKVTRIVCTAFLNGVKRKMSNTKTDGIHLWLHGNLIAKKGEHSDVFITDAGWQTNTTAERLNGLLSLMGKASRICRRSYRWYFIINEKHKKIMTEGKWYKI
jgi:hypothetical protein